MLNSNSIFNIFVISHFHLYNDSKQFFLFASLDFMRDIQKGGYTEQQFCRAWYAVFQIGL